MQPLEGAEELVRVRLVEAGPVVRDAVDAPPFAQGAGELYPRIWLPLGELPGIIHEVPQRDLQEAGVSVGDEAFFDLELQLTVGLGLPQLLGDIACQGAQIDGLPAHLRARNPREVEEVVYEECHASARCPHPAEVAASLFVEVRGVVLE